MLGGVGCRLGEGGGSADKTGVTSFGTAAKPSTRCKPKQSVWVPGSRSTICPIRCRGYGLNSCPQTYMQACLEHTHLRRPRKMWD
jgi:hypothetical protein